MCDGIQKNSSSGYVPARVTNIFPVYAIHAFNVPAYNVSVNFSCKKTDSHQQKSHNATERNE